MKTLTMKICSIALVFFMLFSSIGFLSPVLEVYGATVTDQLPVGALITDTVMHPSEPIMYAVDNANSKLYAINYETNSIADISFNLKPERVEFSNGKLYVTLLKAPHDSYLAEVNQGGAIEVINPADLTVIKHIDVNTDPYDIVVSGDIIYIPSGSSQWTNMKSYSETSGQLISSKSIRQQSYAEFNPLLNKIYTITTDTSPRDYQAYDVSNGAFGANSYDSPYHGDYDMNENFRLSPDGKYLFNGSGLILACDAIGNIDDNLTKDMRFAYMLDKPFTDIAFDMANNMFYTAVAGKTIYSYDYNNYNKANTYGTQGEVSQLYFRGSSLIALSKTDAGQYFVELINVSGNAVVFPLVTNKQLVNDGIKLEMDYIVQDSVLDPTNPIMYIADGVHNQIAAIDYSTGVVIEVSTSYSPGSIAYYNNELLVGFGNQGKVEIYNPLTMQLQDVVYTGATFFDMTVGRDGNIYTNAKDYTRGYSRSTKQELSKVQVFEQGYLEVDPTRNSLYLTSMNVSPMDLYVVNYSGNLVLTEYDSPYHGTYSLKANNEISPDGQYIFNGSGNIFTLTGIQATDMTYFNKLDVGFEDAEFNQDLTRLYTGVTGNAVNAYDYSTLQGVGTYNALGPVIKLQRAGNELIAVEQTSNTGSIIEVYNLILPIDCYNKVRAMETAVTADLTISTNLEAAKDAVTSANTALAVVTDATAKAKLVARATAAQTKVEKADAAITAVVDLETKAGFNLTNEAELMAAEAAVTVANAVVVEVEPSATRSTLNSRLTAVTVAITTARAAYDAAVAAATTKVEALETAAAIDLTVLNNLTAAEIAVTQANTAVNTLGAGTAKNELQPRVATETTTVTTARTAYNIAEATAKVVALETAAVADLKVLSNLTAAEAAVTQAKTAINTLGAGTAKTALLARVNTATTTVTAARTVYNASTTPPVVVPTPPPPVVQPTVPTTDTNITQGAGTVNDAANGTQPINDTTAINNAVNQAVAALINADESKQTVNISVVTTQIIANAGDIAAKVTDSAMKEGFIATTTNAITAVVSIASRVSTEANAIELAESFKTIAQEITILSNITTNAATQRQLASQQEKLTDTMQTVVENVIADAGTVKAVSTNMYGTVTVSLNQQAITDLLAKADALVATANNLDAAIASSGMNVTVEKKIVLEVAASTGVKTVYAELPSAVLEQLQAKGIETVEIESGVAKITVAPDFITKATNTQTIGLEVYKVVLTNDLINSMNEQQKALVQGAGEIYDFNALMKDSSGTETKVTNFNSNIEISLPYNLKSGENKENITILYLADDGSVKNMAGAYDEATGTVTFNTNHFSKYLIKNNVVKFSDVTEGNWAKMEIEAMASKGFVSGSLGKYLPANNITRAEFAKLITTTLKIVDDNAATDLRDVNKDAWYYKYVASAVKAGIISGKGDGTFAPNENISRQDMAIMLANAMTKVQGEASVSDASSFVNSFVDEDRIADYAVKAVATAIKLKLMAGKPGNVVDPLGKVTRAEAATVIYRLYNK